MTKRRPLFWQLYPAFMVISLGSLFFVAVHFYLTLKQSLVEKQDQHARTQLMWVESELRPSLNPIDVKSLGSRLTRLSQLMNSRLYLLRTDGELIVRSDSSEETYPNQSLRPEVIKALRQGYGKSTRYVTGQGGEQFSYYSKLVQANGNSVAVIQMAKSLDEISTGILQIYYKVIAVCIVLAIALALISYWVARNLSRPLEKLRNQAIRISKGDFSRRTLVSPLVSLEVHSLGRAMNKMADQLKKRLHQVIHEKSQKDIILSSLSEGVFAVSNDGHVIEMNHIAHQIFSVPIDQPYEGKTVQELIRQVEVVSFVSEALDKSVAHEESLKLLQEDRYLFLNLKSRPLVQPSGEKTGIVIVMTDVTKMKKLETLRKDFVANVSHELRTPLTSIQGYAETLINAENEMPETTQKKFLSTIYKHSSGLESMVNDLLELSRVENESNAEAAPFENISVSGLFGEIQARFQDLADSKKVTLKFSDSADFVQGYVGLLAQALSNLVTNAIYYTPEGGSVRVWLSEDSNHHIFHVKDTGVGIDRKHIPRLFERFYRVDEARNRREGGSGLGLAIVKHIALVHAGEVTVESQIGTGSHFQFKIPVRIQTNH